MNRKIRKGKERKGKEKERKGREGKRDCALGIFLMGYERRERWAIVIRFDLI